MPRRGGAGAGAGITRDRNIIAAPLYIPAGRVEKSTGIHHENFNKKSNTHTHTKIKFNKLNKI